jgi:hypothetical protein
MPSLLGRHFGVGDLHKKYNSQTIKKRFHAGKKYPYVKTLSMKKH